MPSREGRSDPTVEIRGLVDAYAVAMDDADLEAFPRLFLPDGALTVWATGKAEPLAVFKGPGADGVGVIATLMAEIYESTQHHITTHTAQIDGDCAVGTTYCVATHVLANAEERTLETLCVRYHEDLRQGPDGWRFAGRDVTQMWSRSEAAPRRPLAIDRAAAARRGA